MERKLKLARCILIEIDELTQSESLKDNLRLANELTRDAKELAELFLKESNIEIEDLLRRVA